MIGSPVQPRLARHPQRRFRRARSRLVYLASTFLTVTPRRASTPCRARPPRLVGPCAQDGRAEAVDELTMPREICSPSLRRQSRRRFTRPTPTGRLRDAFRHDTAAMSWSPVRVSVAAAPHGCRARVGPRGGNRGDRVIACRGRDVARHSPVRAGASVPRYRRPATRVNATHRHGRPLAAAVPSVRRSGLRGRYASPRLQPLETPWLRRPGQRHEAHTAPHSLVPARRHCPVDGLPRPSVPVLRGHQQLSRADH